MFFRLIVCSLLATLFMYHGAIPAFGAAADTPLSTELQLVAVCMQPPHNINEPFSLASDASQDMQEQANQCAKIAAPYDHSTYAVRMKTFISSAIYTEGTNTIPTDSIGLWLGSLRLDSDTWVERAILINQSAVYLLDQEGKREKVIWKVFNNHLYLTTNFRYVHEIPLAALQAGKAVQVRIIDIPTPTAIRQGEPVNKEWQRVTITLDEYALATAITSGKSKQHPADSNPPMTLQKVTLKDAGKANKGSLAATFAYTLKPGIKNFRLPVHQVVIYQGGTVQNFARTHPLLGEKNNAIYSQTLIGWKGAKLFLAVDNLGIAQLSIPAPAPCSQERFSDFFTGYASLSKEEQTLCIQFPFVLQGNEGDKSIPDFHTLLTLAKKIPKFAFPPAELTATTTYRFSTTPQGEEATLSLEGKTDSTLLFVWDSEARQWRLQRIIFGK